MRNAALLLTLLLAGCGGNRPPPAAPIATEAPAAPPSGDKQLALAKRYIVALQAADVKASYAPDAKLVFAGLPDAAGADVIAKRYKRLFGSLADFKVAASRIWIRGNHVAIEWAASGVAARPWMGFPAKGSPIGFPALTLLTLNDGGLIKEEHTYIDLVTVLTQIGAGPAGAKARAAPPLAAAPEVVISSGRPGEDRGVELSKAMAAAMDRGDEAAYIALVTSDVAHANAAAAEPAVGVDKERDHFRRSLHAFRDLKQPSDGWGVQDFALVEWTATGKNVGAIGPFPATNKTVTWHGADVVQVRDGKISRITVYFDRIELYSQVGAIKPFPAVD